jgi:GntR family transcriptional regulator, transcriptional repressor for pyruvate dehydrogenase complex
MPKTTTDPRFHEISRERVADRVAQELLRLIAAGDLAPGERLPGERHLAEMMNVSRVSIRTALQHLKSRGFIDAVQGGGTRVLAAEAKDCTSALAQLVQVDRQNLHDLAEIRAGLEVWAARRAAERGSDAHIAEIADAFATMSRPGRAASFKAQDDLRLHLAVGKASGSAVYMHLMSMLSGILEEMFAYHRYTLQIGPAYDRLLMNQHRAICEAIQARDGEAAAQAMSAHLQTVLSSYQIDPETEPPQNPPPAEVADPNLRESAGG